MNPDEMGGWILVLAILVGLVMLAFAAALYLIPTLVAYQRKSQSRGLIATLNVLGGWTGIGWLAALVWAITDHKHQPPVVQYVVALPPPAPVPPPQ